ncbi:MAG: alpha/beta fold hydrolase, partial [Candidatus Wenzhouxiangella sp. M2_3B_020]
MPDQQPVIEVRADDGHRFELIDICPARTRRTLLFLPGMGITARHYIGFAKHLAAGRTRVLIHEWRGAGSSDRRAARGSDWGYRELVQYDLSAALDTAVEAAEGEPVWAGGHSLGSQLACITAARAPQRIRGLTLVAGGLPFPPLYPWSMRLKLRALLPIIPLMSKLLGYFPGRRLGFAGSEAHGVMRDWTR